MASPSTNDRRRRVSGLCLLNARLRRFPINKPQSFLSFFDASVSFHKTSAMFLLREMLQTDLEKECGACGRDEKENCSNQIWKCIWVFFEVFDVAE